MKNIGKKTALLALAAAAALGLASGNTIAQTAQSSVGLTINNTTGGCVRAYLSGYYRDIAPHTSITVGAASNQGYMASIYRYGCGGTALKNSWYTTNYNGWQTWYVY